MKILFLIESFSSGGKERRAADLIEYLVNELQYEERIVMQQDIFHYKKIQQLPIEIYKIKKKNPLLNLTNYYKLIKYCIEFKPDIIHNWGNWISLYLIPATVFLKIPVINSKITSTSHKKNWEKFLFYKIPFCFAKYVVSNSKMGLDVFDAPKRKSFVIYNGFDFNRISNLVDPNEVKKMLKIKTENIVCMVASYSKVKDHNTFINSGFKVLEKGKDVTFLCVGRGNFKDLEKKVPVMFINNFKFLNEVVDIENIMNICDIGVLSSYSEGLPNTVIEFMALKKPVIATRVGGLLELIDEGETGFLFNIKDVDSLSEKIVKLLDDKSLRERVGENAGRLIRENFEISKMLKSYDIIYKKALRITA